MKSTSLTKNAFCCEVSGHVLKIPVKCSAPETLPMSHVPKVYHSCIILVHFVYFVAHVTGLHVLCMEIAFGAWQAFEILPQQNKNISPSLHVLLSCVTWEGLGFRFLPRNWLTRTVTKPRSVRLEKYKGPWIAALRRSGLCDSLYASSAVPSSLPYNAFFSYSAQFLELKRK